MASTTCVRKSLVSLNSWGIPNNGGAKERSNSNASCKTASAIYVATSGMVDFWNRVSQQMSYIDSGSTRSSSLMDAASNRGSLVVPATDGTNAHDSLHVGQDLSTTDLSSRSSPMHPAIQYHPLGGAKPKKNDAKSLDSCASGESSCNIAGHAFLEEESPPVSPKQDRAKSAPCGQPRRQDAVSDGGQGPSSLPWYRLGFAARKPDHRKTSYTRQTDKNQRETWHHVFADGDLKTVNLYINPQYEELELLQPTDSSVCSEGKKRCAVIPNSATATSALMETASIGGGHAARTRLSRFQHQFNYGAGERRLSQPYDCYASMAASRKASSWEESEAVQRRRSVVLATAAAAVAGGGGGLLSATECHRSHLRGGDMVILPASSELMMMDKRDLRYYFQHPYARLFVTYFVIFCNFLLFAEDPISHSHTESDIPMVGNVFSFVFTKYPPEWRWSLIKVLMWLLAMLCGMILGKLLIHDYLCGRLLRLKMFRDDQGSWMTMFLTVIVSLYVFSHAYNLLLVMWYDNYHYKIDSKMAVTSASVMKAAACGTWLGDLITALMVTDMMLQDNLYPHWATRFRQLWRQSNVPRILIFWVGSVLATAVVVTLIVSDWISWDRLNRDFVATTELSRAFLASFILVMDLLIVMQDWDFPHFTTTLHVNLPGFSVATLQWKYAEVDITGKWFNYGINVMVMLLDLNMWKNQIFYDPRDFGQYTGPDDKIRTVNDQEILLARNTSHWTWESRSHIDPSTGLPYYEEDMQMNSRFMNYPLSAKWTAFIPSGIGLLLFILLVSLYGRFPSNQSHQADRTNSSCRHEQRRPIEGSL